MTFLFGNSDHHFTRAHTIQANPTTTTPAITRRPSVTLPPTADKLLSRPKRLRPETKQGRSCHEHPKHTAKRINPARTPNSPSHFPLEQDPVNLTASNQPARQSIVYNRSWALVGQRNVLAIVFKIKYFIDKIKFRP
ncbi:hypothetical protein [Planctomicrobium sp. SH664]|uniref:hypothetical protein n=1 Tax=Planctomicrobium sp. SH664 TaxID=3448125 RepID=UPI003F5B4B71